MSRRNKKIEYECRLQTKEGICDKCELPKTIMYHKHHDDYEDRYIEICICSKYLQFKI